jgi:hypothetical protein
LQYVIAHRLIAGVTRVLADFVDHVGSQRGEILGKRRQRQQE